jgi:Cys-rich four helix bundle protein (predicted Tat secretion target)
MRTDIPEVLALEAAAQDVSRRQMLSYALASGAGVAATVLLAQRAKAADDKGSHDGRHGEHDHAGAKHQKVMSAALECINTGEVCAAHCIELLGKGDTSLKACMASVSAMLAMCGALARFAALDAPRLKDLAKVCEGVCDDCEKECRKHENDHAQCKACAESCAKCIKECKALLDA